MHLNLPEWESFTHAKNLLIAGMGGGFDIYCGLPIYFALKDRGVNVHLANYSFSELKDYTNGQWLGDHVVGISAAAVPEADMIMFGYAPELHLSRWFRAQGQDVTVWAFRKMGVRPLIESYQALVDHLNIDAILLIGGGVDSLMRGDEPAMGTLLEDSISLIAVNELSKVHHKAVVCTAFGAEQDILYAHVFENMAALTKLGAFIGACALSPGQTEYQRYESAVLYAQSQPYQDPSVINSSLVSAARGEFGNFHLTEKTAGSLLQISPLMSLYWFFDLPTVARRSLIYDELRYTDNNYEGFNLLMRFIMRVPRRKPHRLSF